MRKKTSRKLTLGKIKVSRLSNPDQQAVKGGNGRRITVTLCGNCSDSGCNTIRYCF